MYHVYFVAYIVLLRKQIPTNLNYNYLQRGVNSCYEDVLRSVQPYENIKRLADIHSVCHICHTQSRCSNEDFKEGQPDDPSGPLPCAHLEKDPSFPQDS